MTYAMATPASLEREPWESGWQVRMRARGWVRYLPAAFLGAWLCGWAFGEWFVCRLLLAMAGSAFGFETMPAPTMNGSPASGPTVLLIVGFMIVWLTFWTFGGVMAMREMLHLLFGSETVRWNSEGLEVQRGAGPFHRTQRIRGEDLRQIRMRGLRVEADTRRGRIVLATFGERAEREALCAMLRQAMAPWLEGERRWGLDDGSFSALQWRESRESGRPALVAGWPLLGSRLEPGDGALTRTTRIGPWRRTREWKPVSLLLSIERDSDGDELWVLAAEGADGRSTLLSSLDDPAPARALGEWLTRHTGVAVRENWGPLGERRSA